MYCEYPFAEMQTMTDYKSGYAFSVTDTVCLLFRTDIDDTI